ncbi:MAG: 3-deoxy-7-phosphoheptulonate synthase, partial [Lachnospiraceae bacterium]|nr:3-deoxy-7-phosphoheptulonate synthase [Lachnospiraceae bacterium]
MSSHMEYKKRLPATHEIKAMDPLSAELAEKKQKNDEEIRQVFTGESDRLILVIGPCSADREDAVLEYISRLRKLYERVQEKLLIIPRIYTNKP